MKTHAVTRVLAVSVAFLLGGGQRGLAEDLEPKVARDLLTVITMEGHPCGAVVAAVRRSDEDYTATCRTGNHYRVRIVGDRVQVEPVEAPRAADSPQG